MTHRVTTGRTAMERAKESRGFTLTELLIVVVIIGILALIAVPRFASTKGTAYDAEARTHLRNAMTAQEAYYSDYQTYAATPAALKQEGYFKKNSSGVELSILLANSSTYKMTAKHEEGSTKWCINADVGEIVAGKNC